VAKIKGKEEVPGFLYGEESLTRGTRRIRGPTDIKVFGEQSEERGKGFLLVAGGK